MVSQESLKRIPIKTGAYEIKRHPGSVQPSLALPGQNSDGTFSDPVETWRKIKPETYEILAVTSEAVVNRALDQLNQVNDSDLAEKLRKEGLLGYAQVFFNLSTFTSAEMQTAYEQERSHTVIPRVWDRYDVLDNFMLTHTQIRKKRRSKKDTILLRGAQNATVMMAEIMGTIPSVYFDYYQKAGEEGHYIHIARNSYPLIADLAQLSLHDFSVDDIELQSGKDENDHSLNPNNFTLISTPKGPALTTKEQIIPSEIRNSSTKEPLIGCPARVAFGDINAIMKLWNWYVSKAPLVYQAWKEIDEMPFDFEEFDRLMQETSVDSIEEMLKKYRSDE